MWMHMDRAMRVLLCVCASIVLLGVGPTSYIPGVDAETAGTCGPSPAACDLSELSATEAVKALCDRTITAVAYASAMLKKAEEWECLNAYAHLNATKVLEDAAAIDAKYEAGESILPLCGLAFAVKDNIDVIGYPTVAGTPAFEGQKPTNSSPLVTRLQAANGVVLGKTRTHELAWGVTTINPVYGPTLNPYRQTVHVGGSSGGTGAIVAARGVTAGFCSDTGGSCRIPGSVTGTVGLRPTLGCWNAADGIVPMTTSRDTVGVMARTVPDVQLFNAIFSDCPAENTPVSLKGLKFGLPVDRWENLDTKTKATLLKAVESLEAAGAVMVPCCNLTDVNELANAINPVELNLHYEMPRELARYMWRGNHNVSVSHLVDSIASPPVKSKMKQSLNQALDDIGLTPKKYAEMHCVGRPTVYKGYAQLFQDAGVDFLLGPTTRGPASPIDASEPYTMLNGKLVPTLDVYTPFTFLDSAIESPGISIPAGLTESGLPVGIQLSSLPGDDALLLSTAAALEAALPGTPPPPPPQCTAGCKAVVTTQEVTYSGEGPLQPGETSSCYKLRFEGDTCSPDLLKPVKSS